MSVPQERVEPRSSVVSKVGLESALGQVSETRRMDWGERGVASISVSLCAGILDLQNECASVKRTLGYLQAGNERVEQEARDRCWIGA